jgi:cytochrome c-type biogenesis protein CcmE
MLRDAGDLARPRSATRAKWIVGLALILVGLGGLAVWAMRAPGAVAYFVTASEAKQKPAGQALRLGGRVAAGTLVRTGPSVTFSVTDGETVVPVAYTGEIPDTLKEGTDVVAEGAIRDGTLTATRVMAKCSSRFVPKVEQDARARTGRPG